ncbi:hypothetical protein P280DRAFT_213856 [Massarina eburnea CBS 473.64]|uniref:Uncharacterized protein n=1 Tax=Massarina eburnea CBS 473.64 TaxID=1395130 RepID=A0A6A6SA90_9PLEO|nr:hypothetical protein P280DRAFT_213856 [Massarina eburnea CBS 473.64]
MSGDQNEAIGSRRSRRRTGLIADSGTSIPRFLDSACALGSCKVTSDGAQAKGRGMREEGRAQLLPATLPGGNNNNSMVKIDRCRRDKKQETRWCISSACRRPGPAVSLAKNVKPRLIRAGAMLEMWVLWLEVFFRMHQRWPASTLELLCLAIICPGPSSSSTVNVCETRPTSIETNTTGMGNCESLYSRRSRL